MECAVKTKYSGFVSVYKFPSPTHIGQKEFQYKGGFLNGLLVCKYINSEVVLLQNLKFNFNRVFYGLSLI
jgi:hypothetical protein